MRKKPHIIIFNPDEMRWDTMGHMGNPAAYTPNLDQFAHTEAVSFEHAYCQEYRLCAQPVQFLYRSLSTYIRA